MLRLLFEKKGNAVWISHLDLMRLFQRAFKRAGLLLTHTQGFNPRPSVSIALPLSVGVSSDCELLDFELDGQQLSQDEIMERLNCALVSGIRVKSVYESGRKLKELALLSSRIDLCYDNGVPAGALDAVRELFERSELTVPKKTKSGIQDQDIISMIRSVTVAQEGNAIVLNCVGCCQNPSLNPMQLALAVFMHLPKFKPDFSSCSRIEIFDAKQRIFR